MNFGKYIIIESSYGSFKQAILFDSTMNHSDFLDMFNRNFILSAGFFSTRAKPTEEDPEDIEISVFGKSVTLKLKSNKKDSFYIKRVLRKNIYGSSSV